MNVRPNPSDLADPPWVEARHWLKKKLGHSWDLSVLGQQNLTPRMRRVTLTGPDLGRLDWIPGQDLVLELPLFSGGAAHRHYTIRHFDPRALRLDIDLVLHGGGASAQWLAGLAPGDRLQALGPRGRTRLAQAAQRHLFIGDETALPALLAMAQSLPRGALATALIEVEDEAEIQTLTAPIGAAVTVEWQFRRGDAIASARRRLERLEALAPDPEGAQAYVLGETSQVRAQRRLLLAQGFTPDQITAEGYWRPGRIGGHDHV